MGDRLKGKAAVVTGGGRGIGKAIALSFAAEGAGVCVADIDRESAEAVAREIMSYGGSSISSRTDVSRPREVEKLMSQTVESFGGLDVLVNNAAIARYAPFLEYSLEEWVRSLEVNLTGCFLCAQEAAKRMVPRKSGKIINVSSIAGCLALSNSVAYSSTKSGVDGFTRVLAYELAAHGICVNAIGPGPVLTEMAVRTLKEEDRMFREAMIPAGRYGVVEDVVGAAVFLASKESDYITGQVLYVDGGFSISGLPCKTNIRTKTSGADL